MGEKKDCALSIVTVVWNNAATLEQTIKSVVQQKTKECEYIIIDGGSTDGTLDIIKRYEADIDYWISEKDQGIYDAMNKGIRAANGSVIGILNSDDYYEPDALAHITRAMTDHPDNDIYYGILRIIEQCGSELQIVRNSHKNIRKAMIYHPATFIRKSVYETYGLYSTTYHSASDYEFFLRLSDKDITYHSVDHILTNYRLGGMSESVRGENETNTIIYRYGIKSRKQYIRTKLRLMIKHIVDTLLP